MWRRPSCCLTRVEAGRLAAPGSLNGSGAAGHDHHLLRHFRSSAAYRCRIAFNLKGCDAGDGVCSSAQGRTAADAFLALNAQGLVPALAQDGRHSHAIAGDYRMAGRRRSLTRRCCRATRGCGRNAGRSPLSIACDIHPLQNLRVLDYLRQISGRIRPGSMAGAAAVIESGLSAFEAQSNRWARPAISVSAIRRRSLIFASCPSFFPPRGSVPISARWRRSGASRRRRTRIPPSMRRTRPGSLIPKRKAQRLFRRRAVLWPHRACGAGRRCAQMPAEPAAQPALAKSRRGNDHGFSTADM